MAQEFWVDPVGGNDGNTGAVTQPFATLGYTFSQVSQADSEIHLLSGIYREGGITPPDQENFYIYGEGDVLIDSAGCDWALNPPRSDIEFFNIKFTGWNLYFHKETVYPYAGYSFAFHDCVFYQKGALHDTTVWAGISSYKYAPALYGCTLRGIRLSCSNGTMVWGIAYNSIIEAPNNNNCFTNGIDYCAGNQSYYRGTNGWDTATFPPPYVNNSTDTPDLRFDPIHAQFTKYVTSGQRNAVVGALCRPVISYSEFSGNQVDNHRQHGSLVNDNLYYNPAFKEITVSAANNKLNFDEGGAELTATLTNNTYSTGADYATEINTQVNAAAVLDTHTVTYSAAKRLTWASDGTALNLLSITGTNVANSAWDDMGYDSTADYTGQTSYTGENALTEGVQAGAPADAGPILVNSAKIVIDFNTEPNATNGRCKTPVFNRYKKSKLIRAYVVKTIDGLGEVDNSLATSVREIEVRAHSEEFDVNWDDGTTDLDWVLLEQDGAEDLNETYTWWQARYVLTINKVV